MRPETMSIVLDNINDCVFTVDQHLQITSFNRAAEKLTGYSSEQALGRPCKEVIRSSLCEEGCPMHEPLKDGQPHREHKTSLVDRGNRTVNVNVSLIPEPGKSGEIAGGVGIIRTIPNGPTAAPEQRTRYSFGGIISKSAEMGQILEMLPNISQSDATVLLQGRRGTGKNLFAKAIHDTSPRANGPFIRVDCETVAGALADFELLGSIFAAQGGTIFFDNLERMPPSVQKKLLRLLPQHDVAPSDEAVPTDARIMAATTRDLATLVAEGSLPKALYVRLAEIMVILPELKDRLEDIPLLVEHFITRCNNKSGRALESMSSEALSTLMTYDFPDNVRELKRIVEYGSIVSTDREIGIEHLPVHVLDIRQSESQPTATPQHNSLPWPPDGATEERQQLLDCLERNLWNINRASRELGVHRTTLWRKIKRLNINRPGEE